MPRGIPNRAAEVQSERRRKRGGAHTGKLAVPEEMLDRDNFEYRWASDKDNRLQDLTVGDDYDFVRTPAINGETEGTQVTRNVGTHDGKPLKGYLLRKPKPFYDADQKEKLEPVKQMEDEIRRGGTGHLRGEDRSDLGATYTPGITGANIIDGR